MSRSVTEPRITSRIASVCRATTGSVSARGILNFFFRVDHFAAPLYIYCPPLDCLYELNKISLPSPVFLISHMGKTNNGLVVSRAITRRRRDNGLITGILVSRRHLPCIPPPANSFPFLNPHFSPKNRLEMLLPLLFLLAPCLLTLAEPMLYMFPTNPQLHPSQMYPNQQFMRGKVRDLPDSGVIYLNRIKPIAQEFKQRSDNDNNVAEVEVEVKTLPRNHQNKLPSSFEKYNSVEERAPVRRPTTTTTTTTTVAPQPTHQPRYFAETKIDDQKLSFQKPEKLSVPEEAELDRLLDDLLKNDNIPKQTLQLAKMKRSGLKRHVGAIPPKLIAFDGTARVDKPRAKAYGSPVSVRLQPTKTLYASGTSSTKNQGPDFDPWERMGQ